MPASSSTPSAASVPFDAEATLHALDDPVYVVGADWRLLFANRAFERTFAVRAADCIGRDVRDEFPGCARLPGMEQLRGTLEDGRQRAAHVSLGGAGRLVHAMVTTVPRGVAVQLHDPSRMAPHPSEGSGPAAESEPMREMTRALLEQADRSALLDRLCREALARCDAEGATVVELLEGRAMVVAAAGITEAMRDKQFPVADSLTARAVVAQAPVACVDYVTEYPAQARALGTETVGPLLLAPLLAHGRVLGVLGVSRRRGAAVFGAREERSLASITDHAALAVWKQRLIDDAEKASRAKGEFIATISHEFRTPLAAVAGYEELLADQILGPLTDKQLGALERMRTSIQHLSAIIEEILTFSRLEAGEERVKVQRVTPQELLTGAAAVLEPIAWAKGLALGVSGPPRSRAIETDPTVIRRILVNLGSNAVKFTSQGSVELEATERDDGVAFAVRDTGIGIAPENISRLFAPFSQLESGFTRRYSGTGLGLYVSRRLAELLHGRIEVESSPGRGSVFTLVVPARWRGGAAEAAC